MRPVLHGDVVAAARGLLHLPEPTRARRMQLMLVQAAAADLYRKRFGRAHPMWGNGSLMAVATTGNLVREPFLDDLEYCGCLVLVLETLIKWRCENALLNRARSPHRLAQSD